MASFSWTSRILFWWHQPVTRPPFSPQSDLKALVALHKSKLEQKSGLLNGPDVDLFRDNAPIGMIVVGADDVEVLDVGVDEVVQLALSKHVVVTVMDQRTPAAVGVDRLGRTKKNVAVWSKDFVYIKNSKVPRVLKEQDFKFLWPSSAVKLNKG